MVNVKLVYGTVDIEIRRIFYREKKTDFDEMRNAKLTGLVLFFDMITWPNCSSSSRFSAQ